MTHISIVILFITSMSPQQQQQQKKQQPQRQRTNKPRFRGRLFRAHRLHDKPRGQIQTQITDQTKTHVLRSPQGDTLRIIVLGGCEEVGRNCTLIEYKNDIIIIDMGLQFPEEDMPGVDYIIPNMSYLRGKEKNIRGVIITHGHYDHIGGITHIVTNIGNPPIYSLPMSAAIIKRRQEDLHTRPLNVRITKVSDVLKLGSLTVSFFHINHNIPDSVGIVIDSPAWRI